MWDHNGVCACGRRTFLFGQCMRCLAVDRADAEKEQAANEHELLEDVALAAGQPDAGLTGAADVVTLTAAPGLLSSGCSAKVGKTLFISDKALELVLSTAGDSWHFGDVRISDWKYGDSLILISGAMSLGSGHSEHPFRIAFAKDVDGFVPIQQCVRVKGEVSHVLESSSWAREPSAVLSQEFRVVSSLLEREWIQAMSATDIAVQHAIRDQKPDPRPLPRFFAVEKPMRKFLNLIMEVGYEGVLFQVPAMRHREFFAESFSKIQVKMPGGNRPSYVVFFARIGELAWEIVSSCSWKQGVVPDGARPGAWMCACWGRRRRIPEKSSS